MIEREIVESAKVLGQMINRAAQTLADSKVKCGGTEQEKKLFIRQEKARMLVRFENTMMRVKTPQDMIFRVSSFVGRNLETDLPQEADRLIKEALIGEKLRLKDALFLLVGFMRLPVDEKDDERRPEAGR